MIKLSNQFTAYAINFLDRKYSHELKTLFKLLLILEKVPPPKSYQLATWADLESLANAEPPQHRDTTGRHIDALKNAGLIAFDGNRITIRPAVHMEESEPDYDDAMQEFKKRAGNNTPETIKTLVIVPELRRRYPEHQPRPIKTDELPLLRRSRYARR